MKIEVYTIEEYTRQYDPYENDPFVMELFVRAVGKEAVIFFRSYGQSENIIDLSVYRILVITCDCNDIVPHFEGFLKRENLLGIRRPEFHNSKWYQIAIKEKAARSE